MFSSGCLAGTLVIAVLAVVAAAQEIDPSSPYFDCPYINYFDEGCPQAQPEAERGAPPNEDEQDQEQAGAEREGEQHWPEEIPEALIPLFPRESLAPDTPPLYRLLLLRPTLQNARRYVRWHARRMERIRQVQGLVDTAGREFLAERAREQ